VPFVVKAIFPERAFVVVDHIVAFVVDTFEGIEVQFVLFGFESRRVNFIVSFAALSYILMIFEFVETVAFLAF